MSAKWRRVFRWSVRLTVYPFLLLVVVGCVFLAGGPGYYSAKYAAVEGLDRPALERLAVVPEAQTEGHTCGLHSVRAIYVAYGVDPDEADLRFRLGTDKRAVNFDGDSMGTIHPDIVRVMGQDGFEADVVVMKGERAPGRVRAHLRSGHPVLAMVRAPGLHWVVLDRIDGGEVVVADSLVEGVYREDARSYIDERVLSAILVRAR